MINYISKIFKLLSFVKNNFMWLLALIFGIVKVIKPFITQKEKVDKTNSKPESRKEDIGVADNNGLKQVEAVPSNAPKSNEVPVGTIPGSKTTISGEGTLKPVNNGDQSGERSTEEILKDLSEILNK